MPNMSARYFSLRDHQLYAKAEKCEFNQSVISFLGYVIGPEGIKMNDQKVAAVQQLPKPQTVKELQRFSNFYRRFIRNFSTVVAPPTYLVRKGKGRQKLNERALNAFQELKRLFCSAPILKQPDPQLPFVVEVDASEVGVGAILSQRHGSPSKLYPCAYFSYKLSPAERNYDVRNCKLLACLRRMETLAGGSCPSFCGTD